MRIRFFYTLCILIFAVRSSLSSDASLNLKNWGLINSESSSHISAPQAWKISEGNSNVVVAVIDTGIDPDHPSLKTNLWKKKIKDDLVYGWDFTKNSANPKDTHGHGTHVAGIIGAILDPATGTSGVAHKVSIMPVKYYAEGNSGTINLRNTIAAIHFAIENGAKIINYSGGGPEFSEEEYIAIRKAEAQGILFVAAAGNDKRNIDLVSNYYYPSAYRLSNILSVAATDKNNELLKSSNWGAKKVDVAAPGERIFSSIPKGRFDYMSGTSQATAFVTGLAALLLSQDPSLTPTEIKEIIALTVDKVPTLKDKVLSAGRVNAYAALKETVERQKTKKSKNSKLLAIKRPNNLIRTLFSE